MEQPERDYLIANAKLNAIAANNVFQSSPTHLINADNYGQYFDSTSNTSSVQPSASLQAVAEEFNTKQPEPQPLKRLRRGTHENPPEQTTKTNDSSQPVHQNHHVHKRLSEFEKQEFITLVHKLYLDVYDAVITYMAIASNMVETEATVSHNNSKKKKSSKRREQDYDDTQMVEKYRRRFQSEDDENYHRNRDNRANRYYYPNDNYYDHYDNKNNKRKIKSSGTAISDQNNNNNKDPDNNDNNNNNDNDDSEDHQENEEEEED